MCEVPKPGDQCLFTGTLLAVPDVAKLLMSGKNVSMHGALREQGRSKKENGGVSGFKELGCREMGYKLVFSAGNVETSHEKVSFCIYLLSSLC